MTPRGLIAGDAVSIMNGWKEPCVDLTVTSPPYENLRDYNGYSFDAKSMLAAILNVTNPGGVCVWVVGEKINGGRSLASFEHAFLGRTVGWIVHDVMIYQKKNTPFMRSNAYTNCYELMIIFLKVSQRHLTRSQSQQGAMAGKQLYLIKALTRSIEKGP